MKTAAKFVNEHKEEVKAAIQFANEHKEEARLDSDRASLKCVVRNSNRRCGMQVKAAANAAAKFYGESASPFLYIHPLR